MGWKNWMIVVVLVIYLIKCCCARNNEGQKLHLPNGVIGPETVVFDCNGNGPYVGVSNGHILKWEPSIKSWINFATIVKNRSCNSSTVDTRLEASCGRPLGLKFNHKTCDLYVADSYYGLMKVGPTGGVATSLVSTAGGRHIKFANDLDIDPLTGLVYFTDSSNKYARWEWLNVIAMMDRTGRLIRYDPRNRKLSILLNGLAFPNGVALSKDRSYLLWTETTTMKVHKYWLTGPKIGTDEILLGLDGYPDNINRDANGDYWVAQTLAPPLKINGSGKILEVLRNVDAFSDVNDINCKIWLGSLTRTYVEVISKIHEHGSCS